MSIIAGIMGAILVLLPFYVFENFGIAQLIIVCVGAMLLGISRANSLSRISGKDAVGDKFISNIIKWVRRKFFK